MPFQKAVKYNSRLRMALAGPSGSGKTYTALLLAGALAGDKSVAVIDTERGSASKYADVFHFDVMELSNYDPKFFIAAIHEAEQAGYGVLVIDSLTHAWNGQGGILEIVDTTAKRSQSKNTFNAWGEGTKAQNALIDAITRSSLHIIVTMRSKTEYVIEQVNGKNTPRKIGMAPVQRADVEYEFDIYAEMTIENEMLVQKSRCSELSGQVITRPGADVADTLKAWLSGEQAPERVETPSKPATISARYRDTIEKRYPGGWQAMSKKIIAAANIIGDITDEQLIAEYLPEIQEALKPYIKVPAQVQEVHA